MLIHSWNSVGRCYQLEERGSKEEVLDKVCRITSGVGVGVGGLHNQEEAALLRG